MDKMTLSERQEKWRSLIEQQEQSGLTQDAFCKQHSLNHATFTHYRSMFRNKKSYTSKNDTATFAPVNISRGATPGEIRLALPNGFHCSFPVDISTVRIREIMEVILSC